MSYSTGSPLVLTGRPPSAEQLWAAFAPMTPAGETGRVRQALAVLAGVGAACRCDPVILAAIAWIETGEAGTGLPWRSRWWLGRNNAGNLGVTGDPAQDAASQRWQTPHDGAVALVAHYVAYAYGSRWRAAWDTGALGLPGMQDKRFQTVLEATGGVPVDTLGGLSGRWSTDMAYGDKLAERCNALMTAIAASATDPIVTTPATDPEPIESEDAMTTPQKLDYSKLSFPVEVRLIPSGQTMQRPGIYMTPAKTTWHDTDNRNFGAGADMHARWMADGCRDNYGNPTYTSWHFTVDDKKAIQHIPLNEVAWHAGDGSGPGNMTSIAIEECVNYDRDATKTRANAAELHAFLIRELKLPGGIEACVQHNFWSGKNCPATIRNAGLWPQVRKLMADRLGSGPAKLIYADAAPIPRGSRVVNGHVFLAPGGKTVQVDVIPTKWADTDQPATGPKIVRGTKLTQDQIAHYVQGTDGNLWVELTGVPGVKDGSRIPAAALIGDAA